jgi:hypothetical protein
VGDDGPHTGRGPRTAKVAWHYVWALIAAGAYLLIDWQHHGDTLLAVTEKGTREALYISLAATCGALLGFAITAITILLTLGGGRRIEWLYEQPRFEYSRVILLGSIHALAFATVVYTALIISDTGNQGQPFLEALAVFTAVLTVFRLHAVIKLLGDLLEIVLKDRREPTGGINTPMPNT